jgi:DNA primase catalytic subunit
MYLVFRVFDEQGEARALSKKQKRNVVPYLLMRVFEEQGVAMKELSDDGQPIVGEVLGLREGVVDDPTEYN